MNTAQLAAEAGKDCAVKFLRKDETWLRTNAGVLDILARDITPIIHIAIEKALEIYSSKKRSKVRNPQRENYRID